MADPPRRSWSREEVQEILRRAGERADAEDGIRHEELLAAAKEAGLDPDSVEAAAKELALGESDRQAKERIAQAEVARRRRRFARTGGGWAVLAVFSALAYALLGTATGALWPYAVPVLVYGVLAGMRGVQALTPPEPEEIDRLLAREKRDHEREEKRRARKEASEAWARKLQDEIAARRSRSDARRAKAMELEDALEDGVRAVLGALARAVTEAAAPPPRAGGDFARYVDRQRRGETPPAQQVRVDPAAGARVRVGTDAPETDAARDAERADAKRRARH